MAVAVERDVRWFTDVRMTVLLDTDAIGLLEAEARQGNMPPLHVHREDDESFYVLEGRLSLFLPGERIELEPGEATLAPKGVPHTYRVESETARWLVGSVPGRFIGLVLATSVPAEDDGYAPPELMPALDVLAAEAAARGIELLGPPGATP